MPKINILDKSVYSLIAAGEVIDKPASIVKELMENSIDAGASKISIEIQNGGIDLIRVSDDGCGIEKEQLSLAFLPHTTSKIKEADDLYNIGTLGFRGEALSTIAAVSKVSMISKTKDSDSGNIIKINGGEVELIEPIGSANGTTVTAEDIFYNIPARRKFLKKAKSEESEITNIVSRIILSHPSISIKYFANGKLIYNSSGNGLFDAIYAIYGKEIVNNLIPVHFDREYAKVDGFIGKVRFTKPNRTYQTLIVNGRYVINQTVSSAIFKAYESYIMKSNFPFFVLNLTINKEMIDVNVHPNKLDVKFSNSNALFEMFLVEISKAILDSIEIEKVVRYNDNNTSNAPEIDLNNLKVMDKNEGFSYNPDEVKNIDSLKVVEVPINSEPLFDYNYQPKTTDTTHYFDKLNDNIFKSEEIEFQQPTEIETAMSRLNEKQKVEVEQVDLIKSDLNDINYRADVSFDKYKIIGTLFDTYIIVQFDDYVYFIDQHAGHERVLFDKFMDELDNLEQYSQPLLIPYILETNPLEYTYVEENIELFRSLGFEIDEFGDGKFRICSMPISLCNLNLKAFFDEVLSTRNSKLKLSTKELMKDFLAKTACKHAIKAYDVLEKSQIDYLIKLLDKTPILQCPHGRPILLKVTEKEIEKWFKRIV